ncbi:MAG: 2-iminoacetate synthase [Kiritimatiellia bacterium]|jgi:2-iminoacetate synthase
MSNFIEGIDEAAWRSMGELVYGSTERDVTRALGSAGRGDLRDFAALISPAAAPFLEQMAQTSHRLTRKRFGNTVQMYVPLYLSNECANICTYCGFSVGNRIPRITLNDTQLQAEADVVRGWGFQHVLLVTGESPIRVGVDYLSRALDQLRDQFSGLSIEVQPLLQHEYERLMEHGLTAVYVYQESYRRKNWKIYHPKGRKSNFDYRLDTPDRLGRAGMHTIGLGALIGLEDWRVESAFVGAHLRYLQRRYWKSRYSVAFPRLRPAEGQFKANVHMSDRELVQLICAYRIFDEDVDLSLSTRETPTFRDNVINLGITHVSAASSTEPGGYSNPEQELEQFEVSDHRSAAEVAAMIRARGCEPVWKNWDRALMQGDHLSGK